VRGELEAFLARGERAQALGPILHPSEWMAGTDRLREVEAHARALLTARKVIVGDQELTIQERVEALPEDRFPRPKETE